MTAFHKLLQIKAIISQYDILRLVFLMETHCVICYV